MGEALRMLKEGKVTIVETSQLDGVYDMNRELLVLAGEHDSFVNLISHAAYIAGPMYQFQQMAKELNQRGLLSGWPF